MVVLNTDSVLLINKYISRKLKHIIWNSLYVHSVMVIANHEPREITIRSTRLRAHADGKVERLMKSGRWKIIKDSLNHGQGYNVILIDKKQYMRARVIGTAFLGIDPDNRNMIVFHNDGNRMNNNVNNLKTLSHSQANEAVSKRQKDSLARNDITESQ